MDNTKKISCLTPDLPHPSELLPYLNKIHQNRWYSNFGNLHNEFEQGLIALLKENHKIPNIYGCLSSSGTVALEASLAALNLKQGSNVLVPALTFPASATAILRNQLKPLICDVDPNSWQLTVDIAYGIIKHYPVSAIMPVATFGVPVDIDAWDNFSNETNIPVLIDAAGAFPFQKIGSKCITAFSFHATKPFGIGEGGGIFSSGEAFNHQVKKITNFGYHQGVIETMGCNGKLSEYHAAVGLAQLKRWPEVLLKRTAINEFYNDLLYKELLKPYSNAISQQKPHHSLPSLKVVKVNQSAALVAQRLLAQGIETRRWYCPTLNKHPLFNKTGTIALIENKAGLEIANDLSESLLGLPFHNFLTERNISRVVNSIKNNLSAKNT